MHVNTIGVDLAKNVFQVHGVDSAGKVVITRQVVGFSSKLPACLVGMEACGTAQTRVASNRVGILQHGSALCRDSTRREARSGSAVSPSREIAISGGCSSSVQRQLFDTPGSIRKSIRGL